MNQQHFFSCVSDRSVLFLKLYDVHSHCYSWYTVLCNGESLTVLALHQHHFCKTMVELLTGLLKQDYRYCKFADICYRTSFVYWHKITDRSVSFLHLYKYRCLVKNINQIFEFSMFVSSECLPKESNSRHFREGGKYNIPFWRSSRWSYE